MNNRVYMELEFLLDQIDASPSLFGVSGISGNSACGGKCYQGCKATLTESDYNLPTVQPSLSYRGGSQDNNGGKVNAHLNESSKPERQASITYDTRKA